jgi:hypothetical protein
MRLYHRTTKAAAEAILRDGFRNGRGSYLTAQEHEGVWVSDQPLDANEGAGGSALLSVEIPEDVVAQYEWAEVGRGFREFLVPAEVVNRHGGAPRLRAVEVHITCTCGWFRGLEFRRTVPSPAAILTRARRHGNLPGHHLAIQDERRRPEHEQEEA